MCVINETFVDSIRKVYRWRPHIYIAIVRSLSYQMKTIVSVILFIVHVYKRLRCLVEFFFRSKMIKFIYLIFLFNKIQGNNEDILLINNPSHDYQTSYTILPINNRIKRDQSPWFYPDIDKNQISCGHNVYVKLYTCSQLIQCR